MLRTSQWNALTMSLVALLGAVAATTARTRDSAPGMQSVQLVQEVTARRELLALTYPEGPTISIELAGTSRLPQASGEAKIERKRGMTEIEIELDEMKPATLFGGDYHTYVLWVISPEGHVDNVGEFILRGNRSKLDVSTPLETFGLRVSAEPHFLVNLPSRFVVLENSRPREDIAPLKVSTLEYRGFDGVYRFENESIAEMPEAKGELRTHIEAARTAVELAERAGAAQYAADTVARAKAALEDAERRVAAGTPGQNEMLAAHEVIRRAVDAQNAEEKKAFQAALDAERQRQADEVLRLQKATQAAQTEAEPDHVLRVRR